MLQQRIRGSTEAVLVNMTALGQRLPSGCRGKRPLLPVPARKQTVCLRPASPVPLRAHTGCKGPNLGRPKADIGEVRV